ncbi:kynurenine formamidase-like [Centruroides vittatus]|uniref:kynurenine formamidase-like n=1 Tax=Centruroides vittatus TaxID=120091 RepID=UPI0035105DCD
MLQEIQQAMTWIVYYGKRRGSRGIYLMGHSGGAHLAAMFISSSWMTQEKYSHYLKGIALVSGLYDVTALTNVAVKPKLKDDLLRNSPLEHVESAAKNLGSAIKVLVAVAEFDLPGFKEQGKKYEEELSKRNVLTKFIVIPKFDHFSIIENLSKTNYILTQEIMEIIFIK